MTNPGAALSREIARGEAVEHELDAFIFCRDTRRRQTEGERREEEAFMEITRREEAHRREENRSGWIAHYRNLEGFHLQRAEECGRQAEELRTGHAATAGGGEGARS